MSLDRFRFRRVRLILPLAAMLVLTACASPVGTPSPDPTQSPSAIPTDSAAGSPAATEQPALSPTISAEPTAPAEPAWRQLEPSGEAPAAREDGTWTEQRGTRTAFLFGGRDGDAILDDLWSYDLDSDQWTRLAPEGQAPPARFGHEAVWVDGVGVVVFAGQAGPTTFYGDLWAYDADANRWRRLPGDGAAPIPRYGSCAALGPDGRLWISHGFTEDGTRFADTRAYDFAAERWTDETPDGRAPVNRCLHGCWWSDDGQLILYAGQTTGVAALGDLWSLGSAGTAAASWTKHDGDLPPERNLYAFTRHGDSIVVVGGGGPDREFLDDAFTIDDATLVADPLQPSGTKPPGRAGGMLIDDPGRGRAILFGGKSSDGALADLWELSLP
jgi:hypothetical protein